MTTLTLTDHAAVRMAQRGIPLTDAEMITLIGTEVDDGYLVRARNCQQAEKVLKRLLERVRRLQAKRLVVVNGRIVTAFHASRRQERRLLRHARECGLTDE